MSFQKQVHPVAIIFFFFLETKIWVFRRLSWLQMLWLARRSTLSSIHCTRALLCLGTSAFYSVSLPPPPCHIM